MLRTSATYPSGGQEVDFGSSGFCRTTRAHLRTEMTDQFAREATGKPAIVAQIAQHVDAVMQALASRRPTISRARMHYSTGHRSILVPTVEPHQL